MNSSKNQTKKVMHSILHHFGDWLLETNHMSRLESSIYFDMRTLYLTGVGLTADLPLLERHLKCNSEAEKEALHFLLRDKFKLCKKTKQYKHIGWNAILRRYKDNKTCNAATQDEPNATQHATDTQRECNTSTQRSRKKRLREKLLKEFGLNPEKSMSLEDLQDLYNTKIGNVATQDETNATQLATDMQRECNAEKVSITKNQEPVTKKEQQQQTREAEKKISQPENPIDLPTPFDRFAMHSNWQPHDLTNVNALLRRAKLPVYETGLMLDAALDFVAYWSARPERECTAAEWDADFVKSAVQFRAKYGHKYDTATWELLPNAMPKAQSDVAPAGKTQSGAGSKTKQSLLALNAIRQAITSGRVKFGLPETVSMAIVDGLTSLVSARLKYPPPADAWTETFGEWYGAFECCVKEVRKNEMNPIVNAQTIAQAFQAAKKQAMQKDEAESCFPSIRDVIGQLPKQFVPDQAIERKPSEKERESAKSFVSNMMKATGARRKSEQT